MALLTVLEYPDKRLRNKALPVTAFDSTLQQIVEDMYETMYAANAVGLAATQVNIQQRIIVIDVSDDRKSPMCVINPEIIHREGKQFEFEGCVSFPDQYDRIERSAIVTIKAQDATGKIYELTGEELLAICLQHEIDHLDGILFLDHLSRLKQERLRKKLEKSRQRTVET